MNADLERLIVLQRLDSTAQDARRRLAEQPDREKALEARMEAAREHVATAKASLADNQTARREIEPAAGDTETSPFWQAVPMLFYRTGMTPLAGPRTDDADIGFQALGHFRTKDRLSTISNQQSPAEAISDFLADD